MPTATATTASKPLTAAEILALPPSTKLTATMCAIAAGVARGTFHKYSQRGYAPPADGKDLFSGRPYWHRRTISAWLPTRPGRGARTDLRAE